ncbi:MAG: hypothetical protein JSS27_06925 [Planctomycetes bacterium]|nr:hypothetical protein [Planctomycetota bacterium]
MRRRAAHWLALACVAACCASAQANGPVPIRTRTVPITFNFDAARPTALPTEVQLDVSEDRGATWRFVERARADARRFIFQAPHDGEFWFAVRSLDAQGRLHPEGQPQPSLQVQIDTELPQIELDARRGPANEIEIRWRIVDADLKRQSFKLSYQAAGAAGEGWQPIAVDPNRYQNTGDRFTGETTLWPDRTQSLSIRAEITDVAGNRAIAQAEVQAAPRQPTQVPLARNGEPIQTGQRHVASGEPIAAPRPEMGPRIDGEMIGRGVPTNNVPHLPRTFPVSNGNDLPTPTTSQRPANAPLAITPNNSGWSPIRSERASPTGDLGPIRMLPAEAQADRAVELLPEPPANLAGPRLSGAPAASQGSHLPAGVHAPMVNKRRFELAYDIASVGPEGVSKVELWMTRDGGLNWDLWQADDDNRSPMVVSVPEEGTYGFRIVVETASGLRSSLPRSGDLPEIWVGVDTTPPEAQLDVDVASMTARPGELTIHWHAADQQFAARPISLAYGPTAQGPWTTIAAGLENTGKYDWRLDSRVADEVFIRLEVRDEAGNTTTVVTPKAVSIERVRPQARLLNVRPVIDATDK